MRFWVLAILLFALTPAQAQEPAIVVASGTVLEVVGPCDGEAVLSSRTTITVLGTIRAISRDCTPDPTRSQAPSGTHLIIEAPLLVLGPDGVVEGADGLDGVPADLEYLVDTHTAQAGGHAGNIILRAPVSNYGAITSRGLVILGNGGHGADFICDGQTCLPGPDAFILTATGGKGGNAGELIVDAVNPGLSSLAGRGGDGGQATIRFEGVAVMDDGIKVKARGGDGGEGSPSGAGGNATAYAPNGRSGANGHDGGWGRAGGDGGDADAQGGAGGGFGWSAGPSGFGMAHGGNGGHGGHGIMDPCSDSGRRGGDGGAGGRGVVRGHGSATGGTGGNGGAGLGKTGQGGDGGNGGISQVWIGSGTAAGGHGGHGGDGQTEGVGGVGGTAQQLGSNDAFKATPGDHGLAGRNLSTANCRDIEVPASQGEAPINGEMTRSEPSPGQMVGVLVALVGAALVARQR